MSRACSSIVLLSMACTPIEPPRSAGHSAPVPVVSTPDPQPPPSTEQAAVTQALTWRWTSPRPIGEPDSGTPMPAVVRNGSTQVEAHALDGGGVEVTSARGSLLHWRARVGASHEGGAALAWAGDIVVAHYHPIASGAAVTRLDGETGRPVWSKTLQGLGPVAHSKYRNDVQLEVLGGRILVFGRESQGAYVEVLDLDDGRPLQHSLVEPALVDLQWREVPASAVRDPGFSLPPSWSITEGQPTVLHHAANIGPGTSIALPHDFGTCDTGAGMVHDGVLYLAHACTGTSGARLYALGVGDTTWRWQADLLAVGPIAHSAYSNRVDIEWKDGRVLVYGDEAMGRYVEAVDPATGMTLVNKRWPLR